MTRPRKHERAMSCPLWYTWERTGCEVTLYWRSALPEPADPAEALDPRIVAEAHAAARAANWWLHNGAYVCPAHDFFDLLIPAP